MHRLPAYPKLVRADEQACSCERISAKLCIEVAKRPTSRIHHLTNSRRLRRITHVELVAEVSFSRLWLIRPSDMAVVPAVHLLFRMAAFRVEQLPIRPHSVHHAVVDVECWVARAGKEVAAGIATGRRCQLCVCEGRDGFVAQT